MEFNIMVIIRHFTPKRVYCPRAREDAKKTLPQQMSENIGNRYWWRTSFYRPYERLHVLL